MCALGVHPAIKAAKGPLGPCGTSNTAMDMLSDGCSVQNVKCAAGNISEHLSEATRGSPGMLLCCCHASRWQWHGRHALPAWPCT